MNRYYLFPLLFSAAGLFAPQAAQAVVITNLAGKAQTVELATSQGAQPISINAGETWRTPGKAVVRFNGRVVHMEEDEEYAIWPNGDFGRQKIISRGGFAPM